MDMEQMRAISKNVKKLLGEKKFDHAIERVKALQAGFKDNDQLALPERERVLDFITGIYAYTGRSEMVERYLKELLENEENRRFRAKLINSLGEIAHYNNRLEEAEKDYREALSIREEIYGKEHPEVAESYNNLAVLYQHQGDYQNAEKYLLKTIEINESSLSKKSNDLVYNLQNLGILYRDWGKYARAKEYLHKARDICELNKSNSSFRLNVLNEIGVLHWETGNYEEALEHFKKVLKGREKKLGKDHDLYLESLNNLAHTYMRTGDYENSERQFQEIFKMENLGRFSETLYKKALINHSELNIQMNRLVEAEETLLRLSGKETDPFLRLPALIHLARIHFIRNELKEARLKIEEALSLQKNITGSNHLDYTKLKGFLAAIEFSGVEKEKAWSDIREACSLQNQILTMLTTSFSRDYSWNFLNRIKAELDIAVSMVCSLSPPSVGTGREETVEKAEGKWVKELYELVLRRKSVIFEADIQRYKRLFQRKHPDQRETFDQIVKYREDLAKLTTQGFFSESGENKEKIEGLFHRIKELESEIAGTVPMIKWEKSIKEASLTLLRHKLEADALFLDFFKTRRYDFQDPVDPWKEERYIVFFITRGRIDYHIIPDSKQIEELIERLNRSWDINGRGFRRTTNDQKASLAPETVNTVDLPEEGTIQEAPEKILNQLYEITLGDLLKRHPQTGFERLYISPDGDFVKLPFEVLITGNGRYLVETNEIHYLSSGRSICRRDAKETEPVMEIDNAVLLADPAFDVQTGQVHHKETLQTRGRDFTLRKELPEFNELPGTLEEVQNIERIMRANRITVDRKLTKNNANETVIKSLKAPKILHLATHGFFLETRRDIHPFLRSGIALSGINNIIRNEALPEEYKNGIITANDVLSMNLSGTELVTLSACETGKGEIKNGEGVAGLSSSFLSTGAKSVLMSLWNVPDYFTKDLMTSFYENLFKGMKKSGALREAKLSMIEKLRSEWGDAPGWIWGGFVLIGDSDRRTNSTS